MVIVNYYNTEKKNMKKKFLIYVLTFVLILPCAMLLSGCFSDDKKIIKQKLHRQALQLLTFIIKMEMTLKVQSM